jgi:hypothetical protein
VLEVYDAVAPGPLFALHHTEPNLECPVGRGIQPALYGLYRGAEQALGAELADMSIADVLRERYGRDSDRNAARPGRAPRPAENSSNIELGGHRDELRPARDVHQRDHARAPKDHIRLRKSLSRSLAEPDTFGLVQQVMQGSARPIVGRPSSARAAAQARAPRRRPRFRLSRRTVRSLSCSARLGAVPNPRARSGRAACGPFRLGLGTPHRHVHRRFPFAVTLLS